VLTVGVEEEYLLLDPGTALPVAASREVRAAAHRQPELRRDEVQDELLQVQVEVATPVARDLEEVGSHLLRLRQELGEAARSQGCRLAATGAAPLAELAEAPVTDKPRYRAIHEAAPQLVDEQLINGMHVHVAVPDRAAGVQVMNRLRPWLPVLVAVGANSPLWQGRDTGFASWRTVHFERWPVQGQPPVFASLADHERRAQALLDAGVVLDRGQLYWQVRLSDQYPTVEVRAADVQLRAEDAVLVAGLARALVGTALAEQDAGRPLPDVAPELLRAAVWHAARHGLSGDLVDLRSWRLRPARDVVLDLLDAGRTTLDACGDTERVTRLAERLLRNGTGADRQREALSAAGMPGLVDLLTADPG
jgi:carboxylate-amine ligase